MDLAPKYDHPRVDPRKPLLIVDVDEVLGRFFHGFALFVDTRGCRLRMERFALLENLYRLGEDEPLDAAAARALLSEFFRIGTEDIEPVQGAAESLRSLERGGASVVILTNSPEHAREPRARWLARHRMDYPFVINQGVKGPAVAALAAQTEGPVAFVDDLLMNLESAAEAAPRVHRFQLVADPRLQPIAPSAPERHRRIDRWQELRDTLAETLGLRL